MCGICGYIDFKSSLSHGESVIRRMTETMRHRGSNDQGCKLENSEHFQLGFGHARLSILDLSALGHQPMSYQGLDIVLNGEVYNFIQIRVSERKIGLQKCIGEFHYLWSYEKETIVW